ncbi:MAG: 4-hydroxy-tetrahydrodipicolinate synthase [Phycisphaerae bacterium]
MTGTGGETMSRLRGAMTALVTPFRGEDVDWDRLGALVEFQVSGGIDWLVPCGTTGESPTLSHAEHEKVLDAVLERSAGRCPVLAGAGSNCTSEAIRLTRHAKSAGADAVMLVAPYYNRPSPEGLFRHFAAVADAVDVPIVLYNVPFRTGVAIGNDVVVRLRAAYPHVIGIKHATGSVDGVTELASRCDIAVLSGDDALTLPLLSLGAVGVISVVANIVPGWMKSLVDTWRDGAPAIALGWHRRITDLADGLAVHGPNPIPIKTAMALRGMLTEAFRLPLCPMGAAARSAVAALLGRHELL